MNRSFVLLQPEGTSFYRLGPVLGKGWDRENRLQSGFSGLGQKTGPSRTCKHYNTHVAPVLPLPSMHRPPFCHLDPGSSAVRLPSPIAESSCSAYWPILPNGPHSPQSLLQVTPTPAPSCRTGEPWLQVRGH